MMFPTSCDAISLKKRESNVDHDVTGDLWRITWRAISSRPFLERRAHIHSITNNLSPRLKIWLIFFVVGSIELHSRRTLLCELLFESFKRYSPFVVIVISISLDGVFPG